MIQNLTKFANEFMHIYFWVYLCILIITALYISTDEYKKIKEIQIQKGTYQTKISVSSFIALIIWIMSWSY